MRARIRANRGQRIAILVGLAAALAVLGHWVTQLGRHPFSGWTGYAPLMTPGDLTVGGPHPWLRVLIWLVIVAFWTVIAWLLLRDPAASEGV